MCMARSKAARNPACCSSLRMNVNLGQGLANTTEASSMAVFPLHTYGHSQLDEDGGLLFDADAGGCYFMLMRRTCTTSCIWLNWVTPAVMLLSCPWC